MDEMKWHNFDRIMAGLVQNPQGGCPRCAANAAQGPVARAEATAPIDAVMPAACDTEDCNPVPLAMAYVPMQVWCNIYEPGMALERGTLFAALDKPFIGEGVQ